MGDPTQSLNKTETTGNSFTGNHPTFLLQSKIIHIYSYKDLCREVNSDDLQIGALYLMTIEVLSALMLTLRAVILRESTVECLKMYHRDWPISLLTNF